MRLIDADNLIDKLKDWLGDKEDYDMNAPHDVGYYAAMNRAIRFTALSHTIDAVPVVLCKDCRKRGGYQCPMYHTETCLDDLDGFDDYSVDRTDDDGFCNLGERMDGEAGCGSI